MNTLDNAFAKRIADLRADADQLAEAACNPRLHSDVELMAVELRRRFPSWDSDELKPTVQTVGDDVHVQLAPYGITTVEYEELINQPGARLSYDTRSLQWDFKERLLFSNVVVTCTFQAKVPEDDRELLREMNKIIDEVARNERAVC